MIITRLLLVLLLLPSLSFAQQQRADSLLLEYKKIKGLAADSTLGNSLFEIAQTYEQDSQFELAKSYYKQSLAKYKTADLAAKSFAVFKQLGIIARKQGDYKKALANYEKATEIAQNLNDTTALGSCYNNMAIVYWVKGDYPHALELFQQALLIQQKLGNKKREALTIGNIGMLYGLQENSQKALDYYEQALSILREIGDKRGISIFTVNTAIIYKKNGEYKEAMRLYEEALELQKEVNDQSIIASCLTDLGLVHSALGNYSQAEQFLEQSLSINKKIGNEASQVHALNGLANLAIAKQDLTSALIFGKKASKIAEKYGIFLDRKEVYETLSKIYEKQGKHQSALKFYKLNVSMKDSIFNEKNTERFARLESEFNFEKERERIILEKERNELAYELKIKQGNIVRNIILFSLVIGLGFGFFIYKNYRIRGRVNTLLKERNSRIGDQNKKITKQNDELNYANMQLIEARMDMLEALDNERKAHENLKQAEKQLVQSEKMASLGQLTAGIAHEINNPLNYITGSIQVLEENLKILENDVKVLKDADFSPLPTDIQKKLKELSRLINEGELLHDMQYMLPSIQEGTDRIKRIVDSLKVFASDGEETLQGGNIHADLDATIALVGATWRKNINIRTYYDHNIPNFYGYHSLINQMLLQLLTNSVDSIEGEGELRIYTELLNPNELEIRIQDTGKGIPAEVRDKVFDPFFTTKDIGKGSGLGLAQVYSIVQKHQGSIRFVTTEKVGTTFFIRLRITQD